MLYLKKNKPLFLFRLLSRKPLIFRLKTLLFCQHISAAAFIA